MSNLRDILEHSPAISQEVHTAYASTTHYTVNTKTLENKLEASIQAVEDTYEVKPAITPEQLRILFKIINKQLPNCGRKRGAILRYIEAYTPEPKPDYGKRIVQHLRKL